MIDLPIGMLIAPTPPMDGIVRIASKTVVSDVSRKDKNNPTLTLDYGKSDIILGYTPE